MSTAAMGAHVMYCGHDGWFVADIFAFNGVNVVKANGPVTTKNIIRNRSDEATHWVSDAPSRGFWCPDRGIFVVPEAQVLDLREEKDCKRCGNQRTVKVLGGGGDYEDWPCPDCRTESHNRALALQHGVADAEAE